MLCSSPPRVRPGEAGPVFESPPPLQTPAVIPARPPPQPSSCVATVRSRSMPPPLVLCTGPAAQERLPGQRAGAGLCQPGPPPSSARPRTQAARRCGVMAVAAMVQSDGGGEVLGGWWWRWRWRWRWLLRSSPPLALQLHLLGGLFEGHSAHDRGCSLHSHSCVTRGPPQPARLGLGCRSPAQASVRAVAATWPRTPTSPGTSTAAARWASRGAGAPSALLQPFPSAIHAQQRAGTHGQADTRTQNCTANAARSGLSSCCLVHSLV